MSKEDPRIKKTLSQIDNALLENLAQFPFSKITTDMLCRCALVNRSTFYKYYTDKFDLLDSFLERTLNEFTKYANVSFILASPENIDAQIYQEIFDKFIHYFKVEKEKIEILWNADLGRDIFTEMIEIVKNQIVEKITQAQPMGEDALLYAELFAELFSSNMILMVRWWYQNYDSLPEKKVKQLMTNNMKHGLFYTFKNTVK